MLLCSICRDFPTLLNFANSKDNSNFCFLNQLKIRCSMKIFEVLFKKNSLPLNLINIRKKKLLKDFCLTLSDMNICANYRITQSVILFLKWKLTNLERGWEVIIKHYFVMRIMWTIFYSLKQIRRYSKNTSGVCLKCEVATYHCVTQCFWNYFDEW